MTENRVIYSALLNTQAALENVEAGYFDGRRLNKSWYLLEDVIKNVYQERTTELHPSEVKAVTTDLHKALDHMSRVNPLELNDASSAAYYEAAATLEGVLCTFIK